MKYDVIEIDCPWWYNSRKTGGERNNKTKFGGGAMKHYPLMRDQELIEFKSTIDNLANDNCIMFMWATMPRLDFAIQLMQEWGFNYKTVAFTWVKTNKNGSYRVNPGYYTASNVELLLIGIKGENNGLFKPAKTMINQIIAEEIREHSRKPDAVYNRINLMYPNLKKISVFARENRTGFDVWGNEINKFTV
jgi:site-specific DNA-methyltransferase (adenine-specific)